MHHDILKEIFRHAVHQAEELHLLLNPLPGLTEGAGTSVDSSAIHVKARGNIPLVLPQGISIADVFVVHPLSLFALPRAAVTTGAAAAQGDQQKRTAYATVLLQGANGYSFETFSVVLYRHLGQSLMKLLNLLGDQTAEPGGVTRALFVAGTQQELSSGLCNCLGAMSCCIVHRDALISMLARAGRMCNQAGATMPTDQHVV
jgi:hypothetical protein